MIAVSLRGENHEFCTHFKYQGLKSTIFSGQRPLLSVALEEKKAAQHSMTKLIPL